MVQIAEALSCQALPFLKPGPYSETSWNHLSHFEVQMKSAMMLRATPIFCTLKTCSEHTIVSDSTMYSYHYLTFFLPTLQKLNSKFTGQLGR